MSKSAYKKKDMPRFSTKICPYCSTHLAVDVESCSDCKKKVGPVNKNGLAEKPTDWKAYMACILSWGGLLFYFWVLGWSDPTLRFFIKLYNQMRVWTLEIALSIWNIIVFTGDRIVEILTKFNDWIMG